jgi:hypothetical protein
MFATFNGCSVSQKATVLFNLCMTYRDSTLMEVNSKVRNLLYVSDSGPFNFLPGKQDSTKGSQSLRLQLRDFAGHVLSFARVSFV